MARLNYYAIEEEIAEILRSDPDTKDCHIAVEGEMTFQSGMAPYIGIYLDRRDPHSDQPLDAGQSTRYVLRFSLWCFAVSFEEVRQAIEARDDIISKVEKVLMAHRTLGDTVDTSYLLGGDMPSGRFVSENGDQAVFLSGGEIVLLAVASTSTV